MSKLNVDNLMDDLLAVCKEYYGNNVKESCLWFEDDTDNLLVTLSLPPFIEYMLADKHRHLEPPSYEIDISRKQGEKQVRLKLVQTDKKDHA
jgi:hypothetical protein